MTEESSPRRRRLPSQFTSQIPKDFIEWGYPDYFSSDEYTVISKLIPRLMTILDSVIDQYQPPDENNQGHIQNLKKFLGDGISVERYQVAELMVKLVYFAEMADLLLTEKTYEYARGAIVGANDDSPLLMALSTRSLIETIGMQLWLTEKYSNYLSGLTSGTIENVPKKSAEIFKRLLQVTFGSRNETEYQFTMKPIHSEDLIDQLPDSLSQKYDKLCEFVHPNLGSNLVLRRSSPVLAEGDYLRSPIRHCLEALLPCFLRTIEYVNEIQRLIENTYVYIGRLRNTDCAERKVFAPISHKHRGDGKSIDARIRFNRCYSTQEFYLQRDAYLEELEISDFTTRLIVLESEKGAHMLNELHAGDRKIYFDLPFFNQVELPPARRDPSRLIPTLNDSYSFEK